MKRRLKKGSLSYFEVGYIIIEKRNYYLSIQECHRQQAMMSFKRPSNVIGSTVVFFKDTTSVLFQGYISRPGWRAGFIISLPFRFNENDRAGVRVIGHIEVGKTRQSRFVECRMDNPWLACQLQWQREKRAFLLRETFGKRQCFDHGTGTMKNKQSRTLLSLYFTVKESRQVWTNDRGRRLELLLRRTGLLLSIVAACLPTCLAAQHPQPPPLRSPPVCPPPTCWSATPPAREGTPKPPPRHPRCVLLIVVLHELLLLLLLLDNDVLDRLDRYRPLPRRLEQPRGGGVGKGGSGVGGRLLLGHRRLQLWTDASLLWPAALFFSSSTCIDRCNAPGIALLDRG